MMASTGARLRPSCRCADGRDFGTTDTQPEDKAPIPILGAWRPVIVGATVSNLTSGPPLGPYCGVPIDRVSLALSWI
jgi:hypothetical protein